MYLFLTLTECNSDEVALVNACAKLGFELLSRVGNKVHISVLGRDFEYEILNNLEFNSYRKRYKNNIRKNKMHQSPVQRVYRLPVSAVLPLPYSLQRRPPPVRRPHPTRLASPVAWPLFSDAQLRGIPCSTFSARRPGARCVPGIRCPLTLRRAVQPCVGICCPVLVFECMSSLSQPTTLGFLRNSLG